MNADTGTEPAGPLAGRRILVVEDEALVAMMIADTLADQGCEVVGPVATTRDALRLLDATPVDGATLDINLTHEEVLPVAEALDARRIRFVLVTGYDQENVLRRYRRWPMVQKPFTEASLVRGLTRALEG
ncbi:response regulator [Azospirillum sp. TSO22-1]|uniref:response regulator n=1 Tax=Azospirillum sp. TSO22-1 TaxID=716789 RepID=UPI0013048BDD|nr:response regulator [Azospirillum sp. TSO22-1]